MRWLEIATFGVGFVLVFVSRQIDSDRLLAAGFFVIALTALLAGGRVLVTGRAFFMPGGPQSLRRRAEYYSGFAARVWGVFFILAGLGVMAVSGYAFLLPGRLAALIDRSLDTPSGWGGGCILLGVFVSLYGLARLVGGGAATARSAGMRIRDVGYSLFGALVLLAGLALIVLGARLMTSGRWPM